MTNTFKHSTNFIYWKREATRKYIKINEMKNLIEMLENTGHKVIHFFYFNIFSCCFSFPVYKISAMFKSISH